MYWNWENTIEDVMKISVINERFRIQENVVPFALKLYEYLYVGKNSWFSPIQEIELSTIGA